MAGLGAGGESLTFGICLTRVLVCIDVGCFSPFLDSAAAPLP